MYGAYRRVLDFSPDNDLRAEVLNEAGYFIASNNSGKLFGDSIPERKATTEKYRAESLGSVSNDQVGYVFLRMVICLRLTRLYWRTIKVHLLIQLNEKQLLDRAERDLNDLTYEEIIVLFIVLLLLFPFAYLVTHYRQRQPGK